MSSTSCPAKLAFHAVMTLALALASLVIVPRARAMAEGDDPAQAVARTSLPRKAAGSAGAFAPGLPLAESSGWSWVRADGSY